MQITSAFELIKYLRSLNVKLSVKDNRLLCKAPTGVMTADLQAEIKKYKPEIITFLQQNQNQSILAIESISRNQELPLSFAQQRLWFLERREGQSSLYNIDCILSLEGTINVDNLEQAIINLIKRHEILRTNFVQIAENNTIKINSEVNFQLPIINLKEISNEERQKEIERIIQQEIQYKFNLETDYLIRFTLIEISNNQYILTIVIHHIITDGWSMNILLKEISQLYIESQNNQSSSLPPLPFQYADYSVWQRKWLTGELLEIQLKYWKKQLTGIPPLIELPLDKPRPSLQAFVGKKEYFGLDATLTHQLKTLAQDCGVTLYITLLTVFAILLRRYTNQSDLVIGTPVANRNHPDLEKLIGFFVNTLALRIKTEDNPNFLELVAQIKQVVIEAYEYQDLPFDKLVEELNPERNLSHHPIIQIMFSLENIDDLTLNLGEVKVDLIEAETETAKFDLSLFIREKKDELSCLWEYNTFLFESQTIQKMSIHFQNLVQEIIKNPQEKITRFSLLTPAEKEQILFDWNNRKTNYPQDKCIHQLFEEQVNQNPQGIAIVFDQQQLTYQELNEKANQLAYYLQQQRIRQNQFIAIYLERSPKLIIAMLAILKIGCAYVPLDINYPLERVYSMLNDAEINLIITQANLEHKLSDYSQRIIDLDRENKLIIQQPKLNLEHKLSSENLAYLMYTSGSTGKPKGVQIAHKSVNRLVCNSNYIKINSTDKIAQIANTSFDAATFEIWSPLLNGGQCVMFSGNILDSSTIKELIHNHQITIAWLTSSLFNLIIDQDVSALSGLKQLLVGGEALSLKHIKRALMNMPETQIINGYGPTENTTFTCTYNIPSSLDSSLSSIPIGKPISNSQVYILDQEQKLVPMGVVGELYIGGEGLAKGYYQRPNLNREKFIPNPFSDGKLYKTGDLARYLPDGNIEFIGRVDNQVKIRGFRIELGEIEFNLNQYPQVQNSLILVKQNKIGEKSLVAYLVTENNQEIPAQELRKFLQIKLPDYMIPSVFICLDSFPLTSNGKIDTKALPQVDLEIDKQREFIPARNEIEKKLVNIWQEVLGVEKVGIRDNFFELGGNSILTMRLVYEIEKKLKQRIPIKSLFQLFTIENIAKSLTTEVTETNDSQKNYFTTLTADERSKKNELLQLTESEKLGLLASTTASKRINNSSLVMLEQAGKPEKYKPLFFVYLLGELGENLPQNLPVYHLIAWTKVEQPDTFVKALARYYVQEIIKIQSEGPYYIGGYCFGGLIALEIAQQLIKQGKKVENLILIQTEAPTSSYQRYQSIINNLGYEKYLKIINRLRILLRLSRREKYSFLQEKLGRVIGAQMSDKFIDKHQSESPITTKINSENQQQESQIETEILSSLKEAIAYYKAEQYSGRVSLFFSLEGGVYSWFSPQGGWKPLLTGEITLDLVPGDHTTLLLKPEVTLLSQLISKRLFVN